MYINHILLASLLTLTVNASPILTAEPIPDDQLQKLYELDRRSLESEPIPDDTLQALEGLGRRSDDLHKRDSRLNCQKRVQGGAVQTDITKEWVPVQAINGLADKFCRDATGTDIAQYHEVSDTHGTTLTNQDDDTKTGAAANVVFAIFNVLKSDSTYVVDHDSCLDAMKKQTNDDSNCYGSKHRDTKGGYWKVDNVGYFGFEIYAGTQRSR
ncbi:MAG: hypothetical protein Q9212_003270 [Teloschistes hypoglaucus]